MAEFQITIIGLGVTGTSIGLALKKAAGELHIVGHDRDPDAASAARKAGAVDRTDWNLPGACRGAGIVILTLPLPGIRDTLAAIAQDLAEGCLVTDTAPVKEPVLAWAQETLPPHVAFVGGDPIGAHGAGSASAALFEGVTYCLCPDRSTPPKAVEQASDLALAVGATPHFLDATEHDGLVALLDQVPAFLALATLDAASADPAWRELVRLGGGRLDRLLGALGETPSATLDTATANAANVVRWLERLEAALADARALLTAAPEARQEALDRLVDAQLEWERHGKEKATNLPGVGFSLRKLFWFK